LRERRRKKLATVRKKRKKGESPGVVRRPVPRKPFGWAFATHGGQSESRRRRFRENHGKMAVGRIRRSCGGLVWEWEAQSSRKLE